MATVAVTQFKSDCIGLLEWVCQTGTPLTVTKQGKELVQVVPVVSPASAPDLRGTILFQADDLTSTDETWEAEEA